MSMGRKVGVMFRSLKVFFALFLMSEIHKCHWWVIDMVAVPGWTAFLHWIPLAACWWKAGTIPAWGDKWTGTELGAVQPPKLMGTTWMFPRTGLLLEFSLISQAIKCFSVRCQIWHSIPRRSLSFCHGVTGHEKQHSRLRDATAQALDLV